MITKKIHHNEDRISELIGIINELIQTVNKQEKQIDVLRKDVDNLENLAGFEV